MTVDVMFIYEGYLTYARIISTTIGNPPSALPSSHKPFLSMTAQQSNLKYGIRQARNGISH